MPRIRLIHWNAAEAAERIQTLRSIGYAVEHDELAPQLLSLVRKQSPDVILIDLTRLPSHGRDVALVFRETKSTRPIPILFVEGEAEKVERIKQLLPDATFGTWRGIKSALKRAIAAKAKEPLVPITRMAGYSGTPLPKKLGIKPGTRVILIDPPKDFKRTLGELPNGAAVKRGKNLAPKQNSSKRRGDARGGSICELGLWFVSARQNLQDRVPDMAANCPPGGLWIIWPKQASGMKTDVKEPIVRQLAMAAGLVDYKVCAVDKTWSGLKFAKKKKA